MIEDLPQWIVLRFLLAWIGALVGFYLANGRPTRVMIIILLWSAPQAALAYRGFYHDVDSFPPRYALMLIPPIIAIGLGLTPRYLRWIFQKRDMGYSIGLHIVRIPIELVLWGLLLHEMVPELMTFEGRNFDIVIGISAPLIAWCFIQGKLGTKALLIWNIIGLFFVLFILANGILSAVSPFQQFAFEQPNLAINYVPFVWLPSVVVPVVIYTHVTDILICLRRLRHAD